MKKAKIMLTAIVVLAIAGGALAFKGTKFLATYCTTTVTSGVVPPAGACQNNFGTGKPGALGTNFYYTIVPSGTNCLSAAPSCKPVAALLTTQE